MDDLVQFLRDRLAEDEQTARAATWDEWDSAHWTSRPPQADYERYIVADHLDDGVVLVTPENADADGVGQHIARHDPARALREVDAKRQLIAEHDVYARKLADRMDCQSLDFPCKTLRLLALPYAAHPDYRDTWRPAPPAVTPPQ
ncbi:MULTISPECIES: DUF6221 family protein [unclassified Streptomyces]|uniref:DUF6221 family protein n=1 Tax=unclassified Streptomyces TaxID=2593676 RepID=UPI000978F577|nr:MULTISPECIES: DUF6221 family protein [unclassified Streptomyces]RDV48449.1 hypothetical protein DDV98_28830 [Streptomyces sp. IB2014 011-12]